MHILQILILIYLPFSLGCFNLNFVKFNLSKYHNESLSNLTTFELKTIKLAVDHFNSSDKRTFKMRYFEDYQYFKNNGPIILRVGTQSEEMPLPFPIHCELAKETGGALFINENRYYGGSFPLDIKKDYGNYKYLNIPQILADIAEFLKMLKEKPEHKYSKVVAYGWDFSGALATWLRQQYPHLVDAAYVSDAQVYMKADFNEFFDRVSDYLKIYCDPHDYDTVKMHYESIDKMLKTDEGLNQLIKRYNICPHVDMHNPYNQYGFYDYRLLGLLIRNFRIDDADDLKWDCSELAKSFRTSSIMRRESKHCLNPSLEYQIELYKEIPWSWNYQQCNEVGLYETLSSNANIFKKHMPIDYFTALCKGLYGPEFGIERVERGVEKTNKMYGGLTPNVTRVVFLSGEHDPWRSLCVTRDLGAEALAWTIPGGLHSSTLFTPHLPHVREAIEFAKKNIKKWIGL